MSAPRPLFSLAEAREKTARLLVPLLPFSRMIEIAGSIRRGRPMVHDIDLVMIPDPARLGEFKAWALSHGDWRNGGNHIWTLAVDGVQVDVYVATEGSRATTRLIRTGSKEHNVFLCRRARRLGLNLHASGAGLEGLNGTPPGVRHGAPGTYWLTCRTEAEMFDHLQLPYRPPDSREIPAPGEPSP